MTQKVAINTLASTTPEKIAEFLDYGNFVADLSEYDIRPVITRKGVYTGSVSEWHSPRLHEGNLIIDEETVAIEGIKAIYSRVLAPMDYDVPAPVINSNELKSFAGSKMNLVPHLGDYSIETVSLPVDMDIDEIVSALDGIASDRIVIKPDRSHAGIGKQILLKQDAITYLKRLFDNPDIAKQQIAQPFLKVGILPEGISGVSKHDQAMIESVRVNRIPAEIRIFIVKNGSKISAASVLRTADINTGLHDSGGDYIDINLGDHLSEAITGAALDVVNSVSKDKSLQAEQLIAAIDFTFDGDRFYIMEANLRSPTLPLSKDCPIAGRILFPAVANTLATMGDRNER